MGLNFHHVGFGVAFEAEWFRDEAARTVCGLAVTPSVADVEDSGNVPTALVEFVKTRQQKLRDAYHAEKGMQLLADVRERARGRESPPPKAPKPKRR